MRLCPADELVQAEDKNLSTGLVVDRENWGLDDGGNWLSRTRTATGLMETRTVDTMNRLTQIGGAGPFVLDVMLAGDEVDRHAERAQDLARVVELPVL